MGTVRELAIRRQATHRPLIALIAHDSKADELLRLCRVHRGLLGGFRFVADEPTAQALEREMGFVAEWIASEGGDIKIGARIVSGDIDAVVFLRDPRARQANASGDRLVNICDLRSIPVATNTGSANALLMHLARNGNGAVRISHPSVFSEGRFPWDPDRRRAFKSRQ